MNKVSLSEFASRIRFKKRIGLADVQRLQRDILLDGIGCREEVEVLVALDRAVACADPAWSAFLVAAFVEFVVWAERPTGMVKADTARWLAATLAGDQASPTITARLIAREIIEEAHALENDALNALAATLAWPEPWPKPDLAAASLAA